MCMIVKNEERILKRCLDSYSGLFDEIIIVDTGSTDKTKEIAAAYTDKIYDFEWINDFAAARNFAFSKATCDYIFSADADEVLDEKNYNAFAKLKQVLLPEIEIVQMKYVNCTDFNTVYNSDKELRPKLFKRLRTFTWQSPIHETIRTEPVVFNSDIEILHMPESLHAGRDFDVFINAINSQTKLQNYVLIMFCKELWIAGTKQDFIKTKDIFENVLLNEYPDCNEEITCILARIYRLTDNFNEFMKICLKAVSTNPCSEICLELGEYYYALGDYNEAITWFINAAFETKSILDIHSGNDTPMLRLADCYNNLAQLALSENDVLLHNFFADKAEEYTTQGREWKLPEEL